MLQIFMNGKFIIFIYLFIFFFSSLTHKYV